jgi:hypothetical protein
MTGLSLRRAVALSALFAAVFAASAFAGRVPAGTTPATIVLPSGWTASGATAGSRFNASGANGAKLQVTSGGSFPMSLPFSEFVKTETSSALKAYRSEDQHAVVSGKQVTFPSGPAVEITATVHHAGSALGIVIFSFLHKGVTYHFTFFTSSSTIGSMRGSFEASARTVQFK